MKSTAHIFYLLWLLLFLSVAAIAWHTVRAPEFTYRESFRKSCEEIISFYEVHWNEICTGAGTDCEPPHPDNPLKIRYTVLDKDQNFLAAYSRDIKNGLDYKTYEIQVNGQREGEIRIHYEQYFMELLDRMSSRRTAIQKLSVWCLGLMMISAVIVFFRHRQK